ncbi:MAG: ABC transporter permease [Eubacteriales bacterium]|nr:ABC transporter permease [Eubacteriales bacterium]
MFVRQEVGIFVIFIVLCIVISMMTSKFIKPQNIINILRQISMVGIMSVGQAMVIIIAGIDLSVGSILAFSSCTVAMLSHSMNPWIAMAIALASGAMIGYLNGVLSVKVGIAPFIATLGMMMMTRGFAFLITGGIPVKFNYPDSVGFLGGGAFQINDTLSLPMSIIIMLVVYALGIVLLSKTAFGRNLYAVGDNERSSRLSGINSDRIKIMAYIASGLMAALAGVLNVGNLTTAEASAGDGIEVNVIAAVVIGGVSMSGGEGSVVGILIGAAIMGVIKNSFILLNFKATWQTITIGFLIILAVGIDCITKKYKATKVTSIVNTAVRRS